MKFFIVLLAIWYYTWPLKTLAQYVSTSFWISIIHSFDAHIEIDSSQFILSWGIWYTTGNTISIFHKASESWIVLFLSGDSILIGNTITMWYPLTGMQTIILSPGSGLKQISFEYIKQWRERISWPIIQVFSDYTPPAVVIFPWYGWGFWWWVSRNRYQQWIRSVKWQNYRTKCLSSKHFVKDIYYTRCLQRELEIFHKTIIRRSMNKNIKQRIVAINKMYRSISYQSSVVQRHTIAWRNMYELSKKRSSQKTYRLLQKLDKYITTQKEPALRSVNIHKIQLLAELKYILKKGTLNIWQKKKKR